MLLSPDGFRWPPGTPSRFEVSCEGPIEAAPWGLGPGWSDPTHILMLMVVVAAQTDITVLASSRLSLCQQHCLPSP